MDTLPIDPAPAALVRRSFQNALALIVAHEAELGQLDAAAGDGDHGAAMVRGLKAANAALDEQTTADAGALLQTAGAAFADAAGGASGALFGALIERVGEQIGPQPADAALAPTALAAGAELVAQLGKAGPGDKTLLDALLPFVAALSEAVAGGASLAAGWNAALPAAEAGAAATAGMVARRGRSARLGERSLGHVDPGAMSIVYLLRAVGESLER